MIMRGDRRGPELLDGILEQVATFTGSSTHQDDVTLLTLVLSED
jgi:serine phosphatase RsbU (regulator of sigma subunit)